MKIKIDEYLITSNGRGYECFKPVDSGKTDAKGKQIIYHRNQQFYSSIEALLKCLPERMTMFESDATTLTALLDEIKRYNSLIESALRG